MKFYNGKELFRGIRLAPRGASGLKYLSDNNQLVARCRLAPRGASGLKCMLYPGIS